jgi:hypothetical protein
MIMVKEQNVEKGLTEDVCRKIESSGVNFDLLRNRFLVHEFIANIP